MKIVGKIISMSLALLLASSVALTGCGSKGDADKGGASAPAPSQASTKAGAPKEVKGDITVWMWENAKAALDILTEDFKKANPNINVKYETIPNEDLYKKFILAVQAGEGAPDVFAVESRNMPQMIKTQGLVDVTARIGDDIKKFNKHKVGLATAKDGKIYATPWDSGPVALYFNKKLFKQAGLPDTAEEVAKLLNTWDDYYKAVKQIKEKAGAFATITPKTKCDPAPFQIMLNQKSEKENVWFFDKEGNVKMDSPQAVRVVSFLTKMYDEGLLYDAPNYSQPWTEAVKSDKVATFINAAWFTASLKKAYGDSRNDSWGVVPLPVWDQGDSRTAESGGSNLAITKQSKNIEAAWTYVKFHLMDDASQLKQYKFGFFPAWEPAYGNPEVLKADPFFAGQKERQVFEEAAKVVPMVNYSEDYPRARLAAISALELCYNDKSKTVEQHLKAAADEVRSKTNRK